MILGAVLRGIPGAAALTAGVWAVWAYVDVYSRPADVFEPRRFEPAQLEAWKNEAAESLLNFHNDIVERRPAGLEITDRQINAFLHSVEGRRLLQRLPQPVRKPQVAFRDGRITVRFEYEHTDFRRFVVGAHLRVARADNGGVRIVLDEATIGRREVPLFLVRSKIAELLGEPLADEAVTDLHDLAGPEGAGKLRASLAALAEGRPLGPELVLPIPPERKGGPAGRPARLAELRVESGVLRLELEPEAPAPAGPRGGSTRG
jgi:hypothetical protein